MKVIRKENPERKELDIKRAYLPFVVSDNCPHCKKEVETDLEYNYLRYPVMGNMTPVILYHECDDGNYEEWSVYVTFDVIVKPWDQYQSLEKVSDKTLSEKIKEILPCIKCAKLSDKIEKLEKEIKRLKSLKGPDIKIDRDGRVTKDGWYMTGCVFCGSLHGCSCK